MAIRRIGTGTDGGRLYLQPGKTLNISKYSVATCREVWAGDWRDVIRASPVIDAAHPLYAGLLLTDKTPTKGKLGFGQVELVYKGLDPAQRENLPLPTIEYYTSTDEAPIETHPNFLGTLAAEGNPVFDDDGQFKGFTTGGLQPYKGYLKAGTVRTITVVDYTPTTREFVGKVLGDNWLILGVNVSKQGGIYTNVEVAKFGDWDERIYEHV